MKKPKNYLEMSPIQLHREARKLLIWNCNQSISDRQHNEHYLQEIKPLHDRIDAIWANFWKEHNDETGCNET